MSESIIALHGSRVERGFDEGDWACRGKVIQVGSPEELQQSPATPFVLDFIDDVNHLPSNCQFVKRMGIRTHKPLVMCRPTVAQVCKN